MKIITPLALAAILTLPCAVSAELTQAANAPSTPADRTKALHGIFHDYWEDIMKRQPEFASMIGDNRYNDQVSDYSVKAINEWLAAGSHQP